MKLELLATLLVLFVSGCVVVPVEDKLHVNKCEISSDRKTLKIIDLAEETNSYYSVSGVVLTPLLVPATAIVSGSYVFINNTYRLGEETIKCNSDTEQAVHTG